MLASFVAVFPSDAPRYAVLVMIDEPQGVHYGGLVAAPAFKAIAETALRSGATVIEVNPNATELSPLADFVLRGPAGVVLPQLVQAADSGAASRDGP